MIADKFTIEGVFIERLTKEAFVDRVRVLVMFFKHAFTADRFTIEAVLIETLVNKALVDSWRVLLMFVKDALVAARLTMDAVVKQELMNDAFVNSCKVKEAVSAKRLLILTVSIFTFKKMR